MLQMQKIRDSMVKLGFDREIDEYGYFFPIEKFIEHETSIVEMMKDCKRASNRRDQTNEKKEKFKGQRAAQISRDFAKSKYQNDRRGKNAIIKIGRIIIPSREEMDRCFFVFYFFSPLQFS